MFGELLNRVGPRIQKNDTLWKKSLEPGLKLSITLRHLAAGDKCPTLQFGFRVVRNTISTFIPELCPAIVEEYKDEVITCLLPQMNAGYSKRVSDCVSSLSKVASFCVSFVSCLSCDIESRIRFSVDSDIGGTFFPTLLTESVLLSVLSVSTTIEFRLPLPLSPPLDLDAFG